MALSFTNRGYWALILGGSSGMGLATAKKLADEGMNIFVVHRDRRAEIPAIEASFDVIRRTGVAFQSMNVNALQEEGMTKVLDEFSSLAGSTGKIRLLFHSIAKGNLKPLIVRDSESDYPDFASLANVDGEKLVKPWENLKKSLGLEPISGQHLSEEDFRLTIHAMATSLLTWTQQCISRALFADDARIIGLTSEGNQRVWPSYAAVSAAKVTLESLVRSMAVELAHLGLRTNLIQAGVTDTPSLRMIPGNENLKLGAVFRNPSGRLTLPEDVANAVYLLCRDEASWINGAIIPVDGGERLV
ncbi:MAG: SDR family oxidoreductase [Bacteroidia bacterium]